MKVVAFSHLPLGSLDCRSDRRVDGTQLARIDGLDSVETFQGVKIGDGGMVGIWNGLSESFFSGFEFDLRGMEYVCR